MIIAPPQINQEERLDSPDVPLKSRQRLLLNLDETNMRFKVYKRFCDAFEKYAKGRDWFIGRPEGKPLRILEIGSGSGGLAREFFLRFQHRRAIDYHLIDMDADVLAWAVHRLSKKGLRATPHTSGIGHLKQFKPGDFDVILSLHVLHHIHPIETARAMLADAARVAQNGIFMVDFERKAGNELMTHLMCLFFPWSKDLKEDGIKSVRRSYSAQETRELIKAAGAQWEMKQESFRWNPYQIVSGYRVLSIWRSSKIPSQIERPL